MEENKIIEVSEESIKILQKQIFISDEEAQELLLKHNSDIVSAILDYSYQIEIPSSMQDNNDKQEEHTDMNEPIKDGNVNMEKCRKIIDSKDNIYTSKSGKEINISDCELFQYIPFTFDSNKFHKLKVNSLRSDFKDTIIHDYLQNNSVHQNISQESSKLIIKKLNNNVRKMYSKWSIINPTIFYYQHQIEDINPDETSEYYNKLATKFLRKSSIIDSNKQFIGPIVLVDNY